MKKKIIVAAFVSFVVLMCCLNAFGLGIIPNPTANKIARLKEGYDAYLAGQSGVWYSQKIGFTNIQSIDELIAYYKTVYPDPKQIRDNDPLTEYFAIYDLSRGQQTLEAILNNPDNMPDNYDEQLTNAIKNVQNEISRLDALKSALETEGYHRELKRYLGITSVSDLPLPSRPNLNPNQFAQKEMIWLQGMQVLQIFENGVLIYNYQGPEVVGNNVVYNSGGGVAFLYTHRQFSVDERLNLYFATFVGTYTYTTLRGEKKAVPAFKLLDPIDYPNISNQQTYFLDASNFHNKIVLYGDYSDRDVYDLIRSVLQTNHYQITVPDAFKGAQK